MYIINIAKHFNAIYLPDTGDVLVDGMNTKDEEHLFDIRTKVGLVLQNPDNQIVAGIVEEDVAFGCENLGVPPKEIRQRVDEALKAVDMYDYRKHSPDKLSGGQKQRVAIAGIIAMKPECIVLDEPTAMLDPQGRDEVISTVQKLNKEQGITIILITHYMEEAVLADRVVMIDSGKVFLEGTPKEVFAKVELLKQSGRSSGHRTEPQAQRLRFRSSRMRPHRIRMRPSPSPPSFSKNSAPRISEDSVLRTSCKGLCPLTLQTFEKV